MNVGVKFSTHDVNNDGMNGTCSLSRGDTGWWFYKCSYCQLTKLNQYGVGFGYWLPLNGDPYADHAKTITRMMIKNTV